jgi:RNA polymerase sigma-70 factor (ECF subfamily)
MQPHLRPVPAADPEEVELPGPVEQTFEEFFVAERARLFGALSVMTGNRAEAEEIMQDSFLAILERWDRVAAMDDPVAYLYRTALNLFRKRLRRASVILRKAANTMAHDDALGVVEARDEATRVLGLLTPRERQAMVLTAYLGYSAEEAGRFLGIKAATVRVLTTRARATVRSRAGERP